MFDTDSFKKAVAGQAAQFGIEYQEKALQLASCVFSARIRDAGDKEWTNVYYFDDREVKPRDKDSGADHVDRSVQLLMAAGFEIGCLSEDPDDHICIAYLDTDALGDQSDRIMNFGTQILVRVNNEEIDWFDNSVTVCFD